MKTLTIVVLLALVCSACTTMANRRDLYRPQHAKGVKAKVAEKK